MKTNVGRVPRIVWLGVACLGLLSPVAAQEPKLRDTIKGKNLVWSLACGRGHSRWIFCT